MSAIPLGAKVIANWQPSMLARSLVDAEWRALVKHLCGNRKVIDEMLEVRDPKHRHAAGVRGWHRDHYDCSRHGGCDCSTRVYIVLWANYLPTMVRLSDGSRLRTKRGDVLLLDNNLVKHRTDKRVRSGTNRWFARAMILHGKGMKDG